MAELRKVMCVEDDADIRDLLEFSLGTVGGYEVLCCDGGAAALAAVDGFGPDLILLDVMMPMMSGPEVLHALRQRDTSRRVPVVFMTAKAMRDELEDLLEHAATGIIVKPFDPVSLPSDIRIYWEHGRGPA
ncbi:MAG: response regulator [Burkholderiaceae bacterium]|nr:response regulator [Accumulibacter sp.]MCP5284762.1 response regulator [Burkholderiaceae bacterium]